MAKQHRKVKRRPEDNTRYQAMLSEYTKEAKKADQRLVRIEKAGKTDTETYRYTLNDIESLGGGVVNKETGEIKMRFNQAALKTPKAIKKALKQVKKFNSKQTSTLKGISLADKRRIATFEQNYGIKFKNGDEIKKFFDSGIMEKMMSKNAFASKTAVKAIGTAKRTWKEVKKSLEDSNKVVRYTDKKKAKMYNKYIADLQAAKQKKGETVQPYERFEVDDEIIMLMGNLFE